jgi:hypothetical protein
MLHSSGHQAQKKHPKIQPSPPPILGVKWGGGMEKCRNKALMLEFLDRCGRNLDPCIALHRHAIATLHTRMVDAVMYPKTGGKVNVDFETV